MEKARITNLDSDNKEFIECLFNPNQYTYTRQVTWTPHTIKGGDLPWLEFGGGSSATLTMELFLDTTVSGGNLLATLLEFRKLMLVCTKKDQKYDGQPPLIQFSWGQGLNFTAVITSMTETVTMFREDGTPVRATLNVSFLQAEKSQFEPPQDTKLKPQSKHKILEGETIQSIAQKEFGDPAKWRTIANANPSVDPGNLKVDAVLTIPAA